MILVAGSETTPYPSNGMEYAAQMAGSVAELLEDYMRRSFFPVFVAALGVGLLIAPQAPAQSTVIEKGNKTTVVGSTAGPINPVLDRDPVPGARDAVNTIQLSRLLGYRVRASDNDFGQVADIVFDRNGRIMYLLGSYEGRLYPLPFMKNMLTQTDRVLNYDVPVATLQNLALNPQDLPSFSNRAFVTRMQEVFGPAWAVLPQPLSAYPPTDVGTRPSMPGSGRVTTGTGPTRPTGGSLNAGPQPEGTGVAGTGIGGPGTRGTGTGGSGTGEGTSGIDGTGSGTSASGKLSGSASGGTPGSTGGTKGSAGGAPDRTGDKGGTATGTGTGTSTKSATGTSGGGAGTSASGALRGAANPPNSAGS